MSWAIESVADADVPPAAVFALYSDPDTWSRWGHNATWAESDGPIAEGGIVRVRAGYGTVYRCLVSRFDPGRALHLVVRPAGLRIVNRYEVEAAAAGSRVRHALEISGPIATLTRPILKSRYQRMLDAEVAAVIRLSTDPAGDAPASGQGVPVSRSERVWHAIGRMLRGRDEQGGLVGTASRR